MRWNSEEIQHMMVEIVQTNSMDSRIWAASLYDIKMPVENDAAAIENADYLSSGSKSIRKWMS